MESTELFDHRFQVRFVTMTTCLFAWMVGFAWALGVEMSVLHDGLHAVLFGAFFAGFAQYTTMVRLHRLYFVATIVLSGWWLVLGEDKVAGTAFMAAVFTGLITVVRIVNRLRRGAAPALRVFTADGSQDLMALPVPLRARTWAVFSLGRPIPVEDIVVVDVMERVSPRGVCLAFVVEHQDGRPMLVDSDVGGIYVDRIDTGKYVPRNVATIRG